jgi:hypothetical protein
MTIAEINRAILSGAWSDQELISITDAVSFVRGRIRQKNVITMHPGVSVRFTSNRNGETYEGTVEKVNRKYIVVRTLQGRFRVPAEMLTTA